MKNTDHQFKKGNALWKNRAVDGRDKLFTPDELFEHFMQYKEEVDANPWTKTDYRGKDADAVVLSFQRPYSFDGFDNYMFLKGLCSNLSHYRNNTKGAYSNFVEVIARIKTIIREQKMTGATIGFFNAGIISKEYGLVDKKEIAAVTTVLNLGSGIDPEALPPADEPQEYTPYEDLM